MKAATKNPGKIEFDAVIQGETDNSGGAWVNFEHDLKELYGIGNLVKIKASFDGVPYRGSLAKMGGDCAMLLVKKEIRSKIGKQHGDTVHVTVELDEDPRVLEIPTDFSDQLKQHAQALHFFDSLSYSHQKEYIDWITGAKKEETRISRISKAIAMLLDSKKAK